MDEIEFDKKSSLLSAAQVDPGKITGRTFKWSQLVLFFILLVLGFSSFQFIKPATAIQTLAAISKFNFQTPGNSDEEILDRSEVDNSTPTLSSLPAHDAEPDAQLTASSADTILNQGLPLFDRTRILTDYKARVSNAFHIPSGLESRVQFWFDIYTKYGLDERVLHSQKYPWLILKVVDVAPILYAETPSLRWLRNQKAERVVKHELSELKLRLLKISKTKNLESLKDEELSLVSAIQSLPGKVQRNAALVAKSLRIQTGQKEVFQEGLTISRKFLPQMDAIFIEQKLPTELTRIPLVESSFNHLATSKAGASGVWQFIGNTGKKFLMVNNNIDERRSPIKSTYAAALLLKEDFMLLKHQWPLAVTAYNHGPGGVRHAAKAAGSYELAKILTRYQSRSFSFASSNYYSEFLAALYAERYQDEIFGASAPDSSGGTQVVRLSRKMHANELLIKIDMPVEDFIDLNPELKKAVEKNSSLPKGFKLHIPTDKKTLDSKIFAKND